MGTVSYFRDKLSNVLSGLGGSLDPSANVFYTAQDIPQTQLEASYRTSWLSARCHDMPALDATRAWRSFKSDAADITKLEAEERRLGVRQKVYNALVWSKLYGGAALIIGGDNVAEPIELDRIREGGLPYLHVMTRHQLMVSGLDMDPGSRTYGEPLAYGVTNAGGSAVIHPSRVIRFIPRQLPENIAAMQSGWGDPLLMSIMGAIVNADQSAGSWAAMAARAKTDTVTIPDLVNLASTKEGEEKIKLRIQLLKAFEGLFSVRILSGPDPKVPNDVGETWQSLQTTFTGIPEMQTMFWQAVSGAIGAPMTKLFGMSPGGMNATGASDSTNYDQTITADQEMNLRPRLEMLDEVLIRSALGRRPADIWFAFNPLSVDSETTRATNAKTRADAIKSLADSGAVPSAVLEAAARGQLIEGGEYPGVEDAYREYDAAGEVDPVAAEREAANDNPAVAAAIEGMVARGVSASDASKTAMRMLTDARPMSLYVSRRVLNRDDLQAWATEQGLGELQPDLHCTLLFSLQPVDWLKMGTDYRDRDGDGTGKFTVNAGGPRVVEPLGDRTAVLMFACTDFSWRHEEMLRAGATHGYSDYICHVSLTDKPVDLTNVQPYRGPIEFGPELFEEIKA